MKFQLLALTAIITATLALPTNGDIEKRQVCTRRTLAQKCDSVNAEGVSITGTCINLPVSPILTLRLSACEEYMDE